MEAQEGRRRKMVQEGSENTMRQDFTSIHNSETRERMLQPTRL